MNSMCRLCLCSVGKKNEFSASLTDDGFDKMLKTVFRFPLPTVQTISGKNCNLPLTVCPPCSTTVRNFYSFTKLTEASQEKLQAKYMVKGASSSLDEPLQYIKAEPDVDVDARDVNDANTLPLFLSDDVATDSDNESKLLAGKSNDGDNRFSFSSAIQATQDCTEDNNSSVCVIKEECGIRITKVEKRVSLVSTKMEMLLNSIGTIRKRSHLSRFHRASFEFSAVNSKAEFESLNNQLGKKEYKEKVPGWLDANITAVDSENRMHQARDLVFTKTFFNECTWTGKNDKIPMVKYRNVLDLFRLIGNTNNCSIDQQTLQLFFVKKLRYSKYRLNLKGLRKSTCHRR
ncbi:uncharacterized protein LOC131266444 [Anopheles coustani]|uniref:uncharacterized protein LOC131266444 n=1 Tax=Anopheles coustani TaxID=139045 RepID=UPI002657CF40|nr:uncharacterized protein LOC131266444 [Anopheles coustani]